MIRGHSKCVDEQKFKKYLRKYGAWNEVRSCLVRSGKLKPKLRNRTMYRIIFKWFGLRSVGDYLNLKVGLVRKSEL